MSWWVRLLGVSAAPIVAILSLTSAEAAVSKSLKADPRYRTVARIMAIDEAMSGLQSQGILALAAMRRLTSAAGLRYCLRRDPMA